MATDRETHGPLFLPEWITELFYGGQWHAVKKGTYTELELNKDEYVRYEDRHDGDIVVLYDSSILGWKFQVPEPVTSTTIIDAEFKETEADV